MNKTLLASLNENKRLLVAQTETVNLRTLDEDETVALHDRVLRARNKAKSVYRREASAKVASKGGRGKARGENANARLKAEAMEEALARVSARLATLARQSARELREARLAAAAQAKVANAPAAQADSPAPAKRTNARPSASTKRRRTPVSEKVRAANQGANARWQGQKDGR